MINRELDIEIATQIFGMIVTTSALGQDMKMYGMRANGSLVAFSVPYYSSELNAAFEVRNRMMRSFAQSTSQFDAEHPLTNKFIDSMQQDMVWMAETPTDMARAICQHALAAMAWFKQQ